MGIDRSRDDKFLCIDMESTVSAKLRYAPAADPAAHSRVLAPRERDIEYQADHLRRPLGRSAPTADGARTSSWSTRADERDVAHAMARLDRAPRRRLHRRLSNCSTDSPPSPSARDGLERLRLLRTMRTAGDEYVAGRRARVFDGPGRQRRTGHRLAALQLHLADHAGDRPTNSTCAPASAACSSAAGDRLRPGRLRHRARCGRPRATARGCRCRWCIARASQRDGTRAAAAVRLRQLRHCRSIRRSTCRW